MYYNEICPRSGKQLIIKDESTITERFCQYSTEDGEYNYTLVGGFLFSDDIDEKYKYNNEFELWISFFSVINNTFFFTKEEFENLTLPVLNSKADLYQQLVEKIRAVKQGLKIKNKLVINQIEEDDNWVHHDDLLEIINKKIKNDRLLYNSTITATMPNGKVLKSKIAGNEVLGIEPVASINSIFSEKLAEKQGSTRTVGLDLVKVQPMPMPNFNLNYYHDLIYPEPVEAKLLLQVPEVKEQDLETFNEGVDNSKNFWNKIKNFFSSIRLFLKVYK